MSYRVQKEFSSDRFKIMARKLTAINKNLVLYEDAERTNSEDITAIKREQTQSLVATMELSSDLGDTRIDMADLMFRMGTMERRMWNLSKRVKKQKKQNNDLRKWLEGYIILLFAIVVCFIIVVFVS